jgi:adenylate kinase
MSRVERLTAIFLGPQGCGKGTQVQLFKEYLAAHDSGRRIVHVEMGKLLRELAGNDTYTSKLLAESLADGQLTAYFITEVVFGGYLIREMQGDEHLIIDGFPRMTEQVASLQSALKFYKRDNATVVLINISDEVAIERLLKRGRADDTEDSIRKRLNWSRSQTIPNIELFRSQPNFTVLDINGEQTVQQVQADIISAFHLE